MVKVMKGYKQLHIFIGRFQIELYQPFKLGWYWHDEFSTSCCGGMGTGCQHEEIAYDLKHGLED